MDLVGKVYQLVNQDRSAPIAFIETEAFKKELGRAGFKWSESSEHHRIGIHRLSGQDVFPDQHNSVGYIENRQVYSFYQELDRFLEEYPRA